ncbi:MAG: hypothetical protein LBQ91_06405, partial [Oscillospiraceae bacterium]|nr:hypothetical protein [Oscillospiraceae bacterium]
MIKPKNTKVTAGAALAVLIVLLFSFASCAEKRDVSRDIPAMAIPAAGLVPPIVPGTPTPAPEPVWINSVQAGDEYQLQAAITNAAAAGPTIIEVMNDIQIVSGLEVPDVCSVKIISGGGNQFIIYGNNHRILYNETIGSDIYLENLVLKGGRAAYGDRDSQGGTINNQNSSLTITRCLIGESSSDQNGGAIYSYGDGASLTIIDSTFVNNRAESSNGGAIYHIGGDLTVTGTTFYNNEGNYYGGAIYASSAGTTTAYFKDCYISHNTAPTGGGLYCTASSSYFIDCTISGNEGKRGFGGGLYLYSDTVLAGDNLTVDNNSARIGAGIYTGRKLTILSGSISDNITGTDYAYGDSDGDGGGVYNEGEFVMFGGAISNNTATDARGGGVVSTGTFTMSGGEIGTNYADTGGGVYNDGYFELASGTIRKNENGNHTGGFDGWGGGVFNGSSGVFLMKGGLIDEHNSYNGNGGGVANIGDFIMSGGEISHNFADHGGGVSTGDMTKHVNGVTKGSFTMQGGLIADNEALSEGGIQNQGGSCVISGGDITRNLTVMGFGGGIGSSNGDLTITGGTISYNEADNGAGIEINTGDLTITGGTIEHNTAIGEGGGILASNGTFIMAGGKIIN